MVVGANLVRVDTRKTCVYWMSIVDVFMFTFMIVDANLTNPTNVKVDTHNKYPNKVHIC